MNVIIPLCGLGERFSVQQYNLPKPLIAFQGRPILHHLLESCRFISQDVVTLIYPVSFDTSFQFSNQLRHFFPDISFEFVPVLLPTQGCLDTVMRGVTDRGLPLLILDGDTYYGTDIMQPFRRVTANAAVAYFEDDTLSTAFSFVTLDEQKTNVLRILEKQRISNFACSGAYMFQSAQEFCNLSQEVLADSARKVRNEYYLSTVLQLYLERSKPIQGILVPINQIRVLGTPEQLIHQSVTEEPAEKLRICFDIDNTLVSYPVVRGDYRTVQPITHTIQLLRDLHAQGHTIILYTARRMKTHGGNPGKVVADVAEITLQSLRDFNIPFDEIHFGKPYADFYIDDRAVLPTEVHRAIGLYHFERVFTKPRSFNSVAIDESLKTVTKTSSSHAVKLNSEAEFYQHLPVSAAPMFPTFVRTVPNGFTMQLIPGIPFSYLWLHEHVTEPMLEQLLRQLDQLHHLDTTPAEPNENIYYPYVVKWPERLSLLGQVERLAPHIHRINQYFQQYCAQQRARRGVVHGDPVFTNILLCKSPTFRFIDVHGALSGINSIHGDILYDFAKILQSIYGYDEILHQKYVSHKYKTRLLNVFRSYICDRYGHDAMNDVTQICNSLVISLIPMHVDANGTENMATIVEKFAALLQPCP